MSKSPPQIFPTDPSQNPHTLSACYARISHKHYLFSFQNSTLRPLLIFPLFYEKRHLKVEFFAPNHNAHLLQKQEFNVGYHSLPSRLKIISLLHSTCISDIKNLFSQEHNYSVCLLRNVKRDQPQKQAFVKMVVKMFLS